MHLARPPSLLVLVAVAVGCGGSNSCSCGSMEKIPGGFQGAKTNNAAVVRISKAGFDYLNTNWKPLVTTAMAGAKESPDNPNWMELSFLLPCTDVGDPGWGVSHVFAADNGKGVGTPGFMDGKCTTDSSKPEYDAPSPVLITLRSVVLTPTAPDRIDVRAILTVDALKDMATRAQGRIYIDSADNTSACVWFKRLGCWADFHSSSQSGTRPDETFTLRLQFKLDPHWDNVLGFELAPDPSSGEIIGGLDAIEAADIGFGGTNRCLDPACNSSEDLCDWACSLAGIGFIKGLIVDYVLKPQLQTAVKDGIAAQECRACNPTDPTVPDCQVGSVCTCPKGGACDPSAKVCMSDAAHGGKCVPRLLGFEGRIDTGTLLASWGGQPDSKIDLYAAAGGTAPQVDTAFQVGMVGGVQTVSTSVCVPKLEAPLPQTVPAPTLEADGPKDYHVGLAISQFFLNNALYQAHQSGTMCLNIDSSQVPALSTSIFKIPLPSLGVVSGTATQDAPMMVVLRPLGNPILHVGKGTYDPTTKKPIEPLLTIEVTDVRFDIYALIEDRWARLFTLGANVKVPVSLVVEGCPMTVLPALGDLKSMITILDAVPSNAEILAEDPKALAQLIPMLLGMAEPVLASAIKPLEIADMNGFRIKVDELKGITPTGTPGDYYYLGVYATLGLAGQCETWGPKAKARLAEARIPPAEQMQLRADTPLPWPTAVLEVSAQDLPGQSRPMEFAWRVDRGLWTTWRDGPTLVVEHPILIEPGHHKIEVRARIAGEPMMVGEASQPVLFVTDWEPPRVALSPDRATGLLKVEAADAVTPTDLLRFAYRVGDGALSSFGAARPIDLAAIEAAGSVEVQVMDEAGLLGKAEWRAPQTQTAARPALAQCGTPDPVPGAFGCSAAGAGLGVFALILIPFALGRRRR